jgi:hypothetical protein
MIRKRDKESATLNLLALIPCHNCEYRKDEEGNVTLLVPKFKSRFLRAFFERLGFGTHVYVHLDEIGSAVWNLIDGKRTVEEIGRELRSAFGERIEPLYDRLSMHLQTLDRHKFIVFLNVEERAIP